MCFFCMFVYHFYNKVSFNAKKRTIFFFFFFFGGGGGVWLNMLDKQRLRVPFILMAGYFFFIKVVFFHLRALHVVSVVSVQKMHAMR